MSAALQDCLYHPQQAQTERCGEDDIEVLSLAQKNVVESEILVDSMLAVKNKVYENYSDTIVDSMKDLNTLFRMIEVMDHTILPKLENELTEVELMVAELDKSIPLEQDRVDSPFGALVDKLIATFSPKQVDPSRMCHNIQNVSFEDYSSFSSENLSASDLIHQMHSSIK